MTHQESIHIGTRPRAFTDVTPHVAEIVSRSGIATGLAHVFVRHTSCSLVITENADPAVRRDLETLARRWAPDGDRAYEHTTEGSDDMAAHGRSLLGGVFLTIPVGAGHLLLGTWQGVYVWEHRAQNHRREVVVTVMG